MHKSYTAHMHTQTHVDVVEASCIRGHVHPACSKARCDSMAPRKKGLTGDRPRPMHRAPRKAAAKLPARGQATKGNAEAKPQGRRKAKAKAKGKAKAKAGPSSLQSEEDNDSMQAESVKESGEEEDMDDDEEGPIDEDEDEEEGLEEGEEEVEDETADEPRGKRSLTRQGSNIHRCLVCLRFRAKEPAFKTPKQKA